jgi:hypothetical protein
MKNFIFLLILSLSFPLFAVGPAYDIFIYSGCPYGLSAVSELLKAERDLENSTLNINFAGEATDIDGKIKFKTGLESGRVEEELLFLAVEELYSLQFEDFIWLMTEENLSIKNAVAQIGGDSTKIKRWINEVGEEKLQIQYEKSEKLRVTSSPTLFINGLKYSQNSTYSNVVFEECRGDTSRSECIKFGECFVDKHCKQGNQVVVCKKENGKGRCVQLNEPKLKLFAIIPDEYRDEDVYDFLDETSSLFPTISPSFIRFSEPESKEFLELTDRSTLPLFFFDESIDSFHNFKEVVQVVEKVESFYAFKDSAVLGNYFYKRDYEDKHTLLISPTSFDLVKVLELQKKYDLQVLPNPQIDKSKKGVTLTKSWLKEDGINLSVEEYEKTHLKDINLTPKLLLLKNNRELFTLTSVEELDEVLEWIESENE